jgi:hypothetical protein
VNNATITLGIAAALAVSACTSEGGGATAPKQGDAAGKDAGTGSGKTVSLSGMVVLAPAFTPVAGAEECVIDSDPPVCATSDDGGMLTIALPANSRTGLMLTPANAIPRCLHADA